VLCSIIIPSTLLELDLDALRQNLFSTKTEQPGKTRKPTVGQSKWRPTCAATTEGRLEHVGLPAWGCLCSLAYLCFLACMHACACSVVHMCVFAWARMFGSVRLFTRLCTCYVHVSGCILCGCECVRGQECVYLSMCIQGLVHVHTCMFVKVACACFYVQKCTLLLLCNWACLYKHCWIIMLHVFAYMYVFEFCRFSALLLVFSCLSSTCVFVHAHLGECVFFVWYACLWAKAHVSVHMCCVRVLCVDTLVPHS
jgi:hypothetical protein